MKNLFRTTSPDAPPRASPKPDIGSGTGTTPPEHPPERSGTYWVRGKSAGHGMVLAIGSILLRLCSNGKKPCENTQCRLQAFCSCARADLQASARMEARIWLILTATVVILVLLAVVWAQGTH